jgi:TP901 family phage tail tape measure protein
MAAGNLVFNVTTNATTSVPNSIIQAQKQAQAYLNRNPLQVNVKTQGLNNLNLQKNLPLGKMANDAKDFEKSINAATSRVLAFSATVGSLYAIGAALKSIVSTTIEVEKALVDIKVVSGATGAEFNKLSKGIFDAAIRTSESFKNASSAALEFSRQGLSVNETLKRTQAALILTKTAGMSAEDAVSSLTATMNTFTSQIGDVTEVVDKMTAVDNAFAVSSKDLADGLSRVGNSSQEAGVSLNETLAAITALQQRTARGGSVIGNALKSIFTRVGRPENIELLNQLGVATQTVSGKSRDAISILKDLSNVYKTLGDSQRKQVSEQIAGLYQINQFQALLADLGSSYSIVDQAVQKATNSMGSSAARMSELNKTTDALIKQSLTNLTDLQAKVGSLCFV